MANFDLDSTIQHLALSLEPLSSRARSALFGACAEALAPLLDDVEQRTSAKWSFPDVRIALDLVRDHVVGGAPQGDHTELRQRLLDSVPNGHELDSPWSTYAQDALICVDAAVVAASVADGDFKPIWIQYAIEPMVVSLDVQGYDVEFAPVPVGGNELQAQLDRAVEFLQAATSRLVDPLTVDRSSYAALVKEASIIRPAVLG
ncbi:hypothetical protein ACSNN7_09280 [Micromonospora sp. URMC 105]|uniref:hypothetical protein n=1 Tax=Micromonospora sp. URMC 105 TaxID=3423413 RepID=UPI003F1AEFD1